VTFYKDKFAELGNSVVYETGITREFGANGAEGGLAGGTKLTLTKENGQLIIISVELASIMPDR
jgi:hypothetical protein